MSTLFKIFQSDFYALVRNHHFIDNMTVGLISFVTRFRGFILLPLITKSLGILDYGIWVQSVALSTLLSTFQGFNLHTFLVRSIPEQEESAGELYASAIALFVIPNVLIAAIVLMLFKYLDPGQTLLQLPDVSHLLFIAVMAAPFIALFQLNMNFYRARQRIKFQQSCNALATTVELLGIILFITLDGLLGALYFMLGWWVFVSLLSTLAIYLTTPNTRPSVTGVRQAFRFSWPLIFSNISTIVISRSDKILIGSIFGAPTLGIYSIAANLGNLVSAVIAPFSITLLPKMSRLWKNNQKQAVTLVNHYRNIFLIMVIPLIVLIGSSGDRLISIFSLDEAANMFTHGILVLVSLGNLFWGLSVFETFLLYGEGKTTKVAGIRFLTAMFNLAGNIVVLVFFGYFYASFVFLISYLLMYVMHRRAAISRASFRPKQLLICFGISIILGLLLNKAGLFLQSEITYLFVFAAFYLLALAFLYLSQVLNVKRKAAV